MKYRVVREGKWFYPQYKKWYFPWWFDFLITRTRSRGSYENDDSYSLTVRERYDNIDDAINHCIPKVLEVELVDEEIVWESHPESKYDLSPR